MSALRSDKGSTLKHRSQPGHAECNGAPAQAPHNPSKLLRSASSSSRKNLRILLWVLLATWCVTSPWHMNLWASPLDKQPCTLANCAGSPAIISKRATSNSSRSAVVLGRPSLSDDRGQQLHQRPALAPSLGPYPWPDFYSLPDDGYEPPKPDEMDPDKRPNPYIVIAYNDSFFDTTWDDQQRDCPVPCFISSDTDKWGERADVMVFHGPTMDVDAFLELEKPQGQLWALHSMESAAYYPHQGPGDVMDRIDIQATPKLRPVNASKFHVPSPYFNNGAYGNFTRQRPQMHHKTRLALWMHNNCEALSQRQVLVQQLMRFMPIDSPGTCLHNYDPPGAKQKGDPVGLLASYKFYIMFENAFGDDDWVSSTYFRTLDAGTVPVYLGAPNILKFAPGERSVIRACDFDSMEDLATYLLYLDRNHAAYMEYLSWKETGPSEEFQALMNAAEPSLFCSMCMAAALRKLDAYDQATQDEVHHHVEALHTFAKLNNQLQKERSLRCRGRSRWWLVPHHEDDSEV